VLLSVLLPLTVGLAGASAASWHPSGGGHSASRGSVQVSGDRLPAVRRPQVAEAATAADFQIVVSPPSQTLPPGGSVSFRIGIGAVDGFSEPVSLSVSGLPAGVTARFSVNPVLPSGTSFLTLTATSDATIGVFPLTVTGSGGGITHEATGLVTVDFGLIPICYGAAAGVVTDAGTGLPVAGVELSYNGGVVATTDGGGHYRVEHLVLGENNSPQQFSLGAVKDPDYWQADQTGTAVCDQTAPVDFALVRVQPFRVSGRVVEGTLDPTDPTKVIPTSTPIEGANVQVLGIDPDYSTPRLATGADGRYDITFRNSNNQPLTPTLSADDGQTQLARGGYWWRSLDLPRMTAGQPVTSDIALVKKCTGSIAGRVTFEDGRPASGIDVAAWVPGDWDSEEGTTDGEGKFSFPTLLLGYDNAPITYFVSNNHIGGSPSPPGYDYTLVSTRFVACGDRNEVSLVLQPAPASYFGTIEGHVYDEETGAPVADADVCFLGSCPGTTTDATGYYKLDHISVGNTPDAVLDFNLIAGQTADLNSKPSAYWSSIVYGVEVRANQTTSLDFRILKKRTARITGVVRDALTKQPITTAHVDDGTGGDSETDSQGRYAIENVPLDDRNAPRSEEVEARATGYWPKQANVDVQADQTSTQDFELLPICTDATITGKVVDVASQKPIEGASVLEGVVSTITDANGAYRLEHVVVGTDNSPLDVLVTASAAGYYTQSKTVTVFCGGTIIVNFGPATGQIKVVKQTSPAGSTEKFDFTANWGSVFSLSDGQSRDSGPIAAGSGYSVSESLPLPEGWTQTSASCDDGSPVTNIDLSAGETVTCTFTNQQSGKPKVTVTKSCPGGSAAGGDRFQLTVDGQAVGSPLACGGSLEVSVTAGMGYAIDERAAGTANLADYSRQLSAGCSGKLALGGSASCTITNTLKPGTASVRKTVAGKAPSGGQSFAFELRQGASSSSAGAIVASAAATAANGGVVDFTAKLVPGTTYALCETMLPDWTTTLAPPFYVVYNPSGDTGTVCTDFAVRPGEAKSFAIDNTPPPGGLVRTIGFWKNWASCASSSGKQKPVLDQTLSASEPAGITTGTRTLHGSASSPTNAPDCLKALRLLDKSTIDSGKKMASDPAFNLAAQLLAAKLNVVAGAGTCPAMVKAVSDAQALLAAIHFNGITHDKVSGTQTTNANTLATTLDKYNNNLLC
jgi:hypothetical protein